MIVISELMVRFGAEIALGNLNARFEPGTVTALTGPNGSGKSTLLHTLAGVHEPHSGAVTGIPTSVAYVPQRTAVDARLPLTVREVVTMGSWERVGLFGRPSRQDRIAVGSALDRLGIAHVAHRRLTALSGGQCQRVLLAQAIVQRGDLVLLDEPTNGLDAAGAELVDELTAEAACRGATVLVASHDADCVARADGVLTLHKWTG